MRSWLGASGPESQLKMIGEKGKRRLISEHGYVRAELPFGWVVDVWAPGLATIWGRFCLSAIPTTVGRGASQPSVRISGRRRSLRSNSGSESGRDVLDDVGVATWQHPPRRISVRHGRDEKSPDFRGFPGALPSNLKAPDIAAELFVSTNTIRTHVRHIYAKLDAHGRAEAVARARELRLLAPSRRRR